LETVAQVFGVPTDDKTISDMGETVCDFAIKPIIVPSKSGDKYDGITVTSI
jgi:hypothetical protein